MKGRRAASLLLALCLLAGGTALHARAAERAEDDYLYYSDIFWGYPGVLLADSFQKDRLKLNGTLSGILDEYVYSSAFTLSLIELGLEHMAPAQLAKYLSDQAFGTSFELNGRIDEANKLLAKAFLDATCLDAAEGVGKSEGFLKGLKNAADAIEKINDAADSGENDFDALVERALSAMAGSGGAVSGALVGQKDVFQDLAKTIGSTAGNAKEVVKFLEALAVSVAMSDAQLEMIQAVIDTQPSGSLLYRGMDRLRDQLYDGYSSYFVSTYLTDKVYEQVANFLADCIKDGVLPTGSATLQAISAAVKLVNWALFDLIWNVSYNDYAVGVVLQQYCVDFYDSIRAQADVFTGQFDRADIENYENLFRAYLSARRAALEHFEKLARHNTEKGTAYLQEAVEQLCGEDVSADYAAYIDGVRADFAAAADEIQESMRASYDYTIYKEDLTVTTQGSDQIAEGVLYCVDGVWKGDVVLDTSGSLTVPAQTEAVIAGSLDATGYACEVTVSGTLDVGSQFSLGSFSTLNVDGAGARLRVGGNASGSGGEITISQQAGMVVCGDFSAGRSSIANHGTLEVAGSVTAQTMETLFPDDAAEGTLYVGGDLTFSGTPSGGYHPSAGTVVFNGMQQQAVKYLTAYRVEVTNPAGIRYESDQYLYGPFDPHGTPLETQGYRTWVYESSVLAPGAENDYGAVCVDGNNGVLLADGGVYRCELRMCGDDNRLTIPAGTSAILMGDLWVGYSGSTGSDAEVYLRGELEVLGDVTVGGGYPTGLITMDGADAALSVHGDLAVRDSFSGISGGSVIFSGTQQQAVSGLDADNVEIRNPAGLRYESDLTVRGHYDPNGNPIEAQGYDTVLRSGATLEPGMENDYHSVSIQSGEVTLAESGVYHGDFTVLGSGRLIIPSGVEAAIAGSLTVYNRPGLSNSGDLEVTGDVDAGSYGLISNAGDAVLRLGGDLMYSGSRRPIEGGTLILNGTGPQVMPHLELSVLILENESPEGVTFTSWILVTTLFDHRGNAFTLSDGPISSSFPDYDGDGLSDHVDPQPTVPRVAEAVLDGSTVNITFYQIGSCSRAAAALYSAEGALLDLRLLPAGEGASAQARFSAIPEGGFVKVFYLSEDWAPCAAAERLT